MLYLDTLDDPHYRPLVDGTRHFRLNHLLHDYGFLPVLSGLSLRNLNFRHADFSGLSIDGVDFGGALCHWADFSKAVFGTLFFDKNTRFFEAKFTAQQLCSLNFERSEAQLVQDDILTR